jgi:hypothetical protein
LGVYDVEGKEVEGLGPVVEPSAMGVASHDKAGGGKGSDAGSGSEDMEDTSSEEETSDDSDDSDQAAVEGMESKKAETET